MNLKKEFNKIGVWDVSALKERVRRLTDDDWAACSARQERFDAHKDTQTIHLLFDADFRHSNPTRWGMYDELEPSLKPLLDKISVYYNKSLKAQRLRAVHGSGYFIRINLVKLAPGGVVTRHLDRGYSLSHSHRVHAPIITNDGVDFTIGNVTRQIKEGEIWEIANRRVHGVVNNGAEPRVHIIADWVMPGERCCCGKRLRPKGICSEALCEETDMARPQCSCYG